MKRYHGGLQNRSSRFESWHPCIRNFLTILSLSKVSLEISMPVRSPKSEGGLFHKSMKIQGFKDTIDWYNQNAEKYAKATATTASLDQIEAFTNLLSPKAIILDAGCGAGRDTHILSQKGFIVTGLDISSGLLAVARKTYPTLTFVEGNMLKIPFPDEHFDGVWSHASLVHMETTEAVIRAFKEYYRVLKQNGILHVLVKAQTGKQKTAVVSDSRSNHERFFQYFTKEELMLLLKQTGFQIISIDQQKETDKGTVRARPDVEWIVVLASKK